MNAVATAWIVARKDLRLFFRDRTGMVLGFLLPIVLVGVFGFLNRLITGGDDKFGRAELWVADEDGTEKSRALVAALRQAQTLAVRPGATESVVTSAALRKKVEDGEAHHGLTVPKGFADAIARGELPTLRMVRDPDRSIEEQLISIGLMQAVIATLGPDFAASITARSLELAGLPPEYRERTLALSKVFSKGIEILFKEEDKKEQGKDPAPDAAATAPIAGAPKTAPAFNFGEIMGKLVPMEQEDLRPPERPKQLSYMLAHSVSGIGVMMLMFGLVACAVLLLRERESGTLPRLLLSPAAREALLWGKFLFTGIVGATQLVILFTFGAIVFKVDVLRDPVSFVLISLSVLAAVTAFGMLIGTWAKTQKQAEGVSTLVILVMSAVGGAWFPLQIFSLPVAAERVMQCTLTHWAVSSYQAFFWNGKAWSDPVLLTKLAVLWGFALVASLLARQLFRTRYIGG